MPVSPGNPATEATQQAVKSDLDSILANQTNNAQTTQIIGDALVVNHGGKTGQAVLGALNAAGAITSFGKSNGVRSSWVFACSIWLV